MKRHQAALATSKRLRNFVCIFTKCINSFFSLSGKCLCVVDADKQNPCVCRDAIGVEYEPYDESLREDKTRMETLSEEKIITPPL